MIKVRFGLGAKRDVREAREWYAARKDGLDLEFRAAIDQVIDRIRAFPESYPAVYKDVRRANLRRFRYAVFYHRREHDWFVLAVIHHARHPRHWKQRRER